jgi:Flp pilus assembly protein TadG
MTQRQSTRRERRGEGGQSLVLFTLAIVALLAMSSLILDAGNAFAQQRVAQNGSDAAANAGAVVLAQNLIAKGSKVTPLPKTDQDVLAAVNGTAANNAISPAPTAYYTDINGARLSPTVVVGSRGTGAPPADAYGVEVNGSRSFSTFIGGIFAFVPGGNGITEMTASATATAIAGQVQGVCPADAPCGFLPVTFPINLTLCDGTGKQIDFGKAYPYAFGNVGDPNSEVILPLCKTGPGTVGWLDIEPHHPDCKGNGSAFLACEIEKPGNTGLDLPIWIHTVPGNTNSVQVQDAINKFIGKTVQIPFYECMSDNVGQVGPAPYCPASKVNPGTPVAPPGTSGNNTYYRIVAVGNFVLDKAYIQSNNPECNELPGKPAAGGNGSTGCLKGWFVQELNFGATIGQPNDAIPWAAYGTQLIR